MAVPPTVRDSKKRRWPIVVFSLLFLGALVGGGIFVYLRFFSYQNTALRHVPEGTNIALRTPPANQLSVSDRTIYAHATESKMNPAITTS